MLLNEVSLWEYLLLHVWTQFPVKCKNFKPFKNVIEGFWFFLLFSQTHFGLCHTYQNSNCHAKVGMRIFEWQIIIFQNYGLMLQYLQVFRFVISCYVYFFCMKKAFSITNATLRQTQHYLAFGKLIYAINALVFLGAPIVYIMFVGIRIIHIQLIFLSFPLIDSENDL